jgi:LPS-assembly protein
MARLLPGGRLPPPPVLALVAGLTLAVAAAAPTARAQQLELGEGPVLLTADAIRHDRTTGAMVAEGNVEISRAGRRVLADRVIYEPQPDLMRAEGNVILIEPTGEAVFADEVALTGDLREGVIESVRVLFIDDSRLAANRGRRTEGNRTVFEQVVYSPCRVCPDGALPPLWRLKASRVVHDQAARTVTYRNARFELFGIPVAYTPYFSHPDPTVDRKTGLLGPSVGSDSELGFFIETPYFIDLAPNRDLTVAPTLFTEESPLLSLQYRELRRNGYFELGGSGTYATEFAGTPEEATGDEFRGHLEGFGRFGLTDTWSTGYEVALTTDDTYLQRYDISDENILENRLYAERIWGRNYAGVNGYYFQGLRRQDDQGLIPVVLPLAQLSLVGEPGRWGSRLDLDANLLALTRAEGLDTRRLSATGGWRLPWVGPIGDLYTLNLGLRGDAYYTDGDPETRLDDGTNTEARAFPIASVDWSWPLAREGFGGHQVIEPVVVAAWTPSGLNPTDIPNEDSLDFEFDDTNLFEVDRFTGLDRVEEGARISYGLRFGAYGPNGEQASGLIGQSYRFEEQDEFPEGSGLDENLSDYVGRIELRPTPLLDLSYRFRARREDLRLMRNEVRAGLGPPTIRLGLNYLSLADEPVENEFRDREELTASAVIGILPEFLVSARTRRDLNTGETVSNAFGFVYRNPCLVLIGGMERRFTRNRDAPPSTTFTIRLAFRNLGEIEADSDLFGLDSS